jgi:hypothetical protein
MKEDGTIQKSNNITVGIKTWAQLIQENRARLQFFQEQLDYQVDQSTALKFLQDKYEDFIKGVLTDETAQDEIEDSELIEP